ncbi:hypothetical protein NLG97_g5786 [Lecanicillium saksenae]|uniref:Uncharacterized protein n=1 Tax=Lecanicillium saksenae TaxID=468837 RepID=A0ACC1QS15_9HYPO|nr:hypothetical protein NLG97_g5786 [Lecanicillium saksenae]
MTDRVAEREREDRKAYCRPKSSDPDENDAELVETFTFEYNPHHFPGHEQPVTHGMLRAWHQNALFPNGVETELLTINAAESFIAEGDKSVVTLYCKKDALDATPDSQNQIHWLHVKHTEEVIDVIKTLITCCPFIHRGYQTLALGLLDRVLPQNVDIYRGMNQKRSRTFVARSDGEPDGNPFRRDSVTHISTPYLMFCERQTGQENTDAMQTLLSSQLGYDGGEYGRELRVLSETQKWLGKETIHVARMRSLVIGPEVLLTWGELPLSAICKDSIQVDDSDSRPPTTVRICDFRHGTYVSSVKYDTSFAELNAHIKNLTRLENFDICEDSQNAPKMTSESWAKLLARASARLTDIHLRLQRKQPEKRRKPPSEPHSSWDVMVVNDSSAYNKLDTTYYLSSSDDGSGKRTRTLEAPPTSRPQPLAVTRFNLPSSDDSDHLANLDTFDASADERNDKDSSWSNRVSNVSDRWPDENEQSEEERKKLPLLLPEPGAEHPNTRETLKSLENQATPFLMWRVGDADGHGNKSKEGNFSTMIRLLGKVDTNLKRNDKYGKIYTNGYRCSLAELRRRHEDLISSTTAANIAVANDTPRETPNDTKAPETSNEPGERPEPVSKTPSGGGDGVSETSSMRGNPGSDAASEGVTLHLSVTEKAEHLVNVIFQDSLSILGLFVPIKEVAAEAGIIAVLDRYWGALDVLFRNILFSARMHAQDSEQSWQVRGFCRLRGGAPAQETCHACEVGAEYTLVDALEHLHAGKMSSEAHEIPQRPDEDPCTVWLQPSKTPTENVVLSELIHNLQMFSDNLKTTLDHVKELHLFIAHPGGGMNGHAEKQSSSAEPDGNADGKMNSEQQPGRSKPATPALPISLLRAFEHIVTLFAVQARNTVLTMRRTENETKWRKREGQARRAQALLMNVVKEYLERSKQDLIQSIAAECGKAVRLGAVGPEYIAGMVMVNVQPGVFRSGAGCSDVPRAFVDPGRDLRMGTRRRVVTWTEDPDGGDKACGEPPDGQKRAEMMSLDLIALYTEHARALTFSATMRPQRQAFFAIRAFEEELRAIHRLYNTQRHSVTNFGRVTNSDSFPVTNRERKARFALESGLVRRSIKDRKRDMDELEYMLDWMRELRQRVIESIEVLDEGHGKAIRVFTLVTLFFLPLSFVTSFFGMNTSDVRDMDQNSTLYWAVALPVTLFVLGVAYLYGYRWEDLTQRITRKTWLEQGLATMEGGDGDKGARDRSKWARGGAFQRKTTTMDSYGLRRNTTKWMRGETYDRKTTTMDSYGQVKARRSWGRPWA